ncbi:MAG: amidohydrolase family protein [Saprospiraceae bacterium]
MKILQYILIFFATSPLVFSSLSAQQIGKNIKGSFVLQNATIHTVTKGNLTGSVLIEDGRISAVGAVTTPSSAHIVDCSGLHIYPGLIDGGTTLGLTEVSSVSLTDDSDEIGDFTPHVQSLTAVNPNSVAIPVTRVNGITTVITKPTGGLFPGTASLINLVGYTPDQMYAGFKAVMLNFPSSSKRNRWDRRSKEDRKKEGGKAVKKLNDIWKKAKLHADLISKGQKTEYNPDLDALVSVVRGQTPLMIEANKKDDILAAIKWVRKNKVKAILSGCSEGFRVVDSLAAAGLPVITGPMMTMPPRGSDRYDRAYSNAGIMSNGGVKVVIRSNQSENVRNLPFEAGFAAAYGMGKEEALKAVTINAAEVFGLGDQLGSIEVGKVANIIVTDGDPFETKTQVKHIFINGWQVPTESRHTLLYDEFIERSPGLDK